MASTTHHARSERPKRRVRRFASFLVAWSFAVLLISGIVLFVAPSGRVARDVAWHLAGLDKENWGGLHLIFAILFVVFAVLHLALNWRPFQGYLVDRASHHLRLSPELLISLAVVGFLVFATVANVPPAPQLAAATEYFRKSFWSPPTGSSAAPAGQRTATRVGSPLVGCGADIRQRCLIIRARNIVSNW